MFPFVFVFYFIGSFNMRHIKLTKAKDSNIYFNKKINKTVCFTFRIFFIIVSNYVRVSALKNFPLQVIKVRSTFQYLPLSIWTSKSNCRIFISTSFVVGVSTTKRIFKKCINTKKIQIFLLVITCVEVDSNKKVPQ